HSFSLKGCKILSGGAIQHKMAVKASAFSEKAKQKIIAAGGTAEVLL
ncbi:MAG: uL15m family ribosomal protein, partial [Candidatus Micrarchaeota archaeon]